MAEQQIAYVEPFASAFERMRALLFQPFDLARWLTIAFTAWLATLGNGGGGFRVNLPAPQDGRHHVSVAAIRSYVHEHLWLIIALVGLVCLISLAVSLVLLWLGSRGRFMFLDNAVTGRAAVVEPWRKYRRPGNSLFVWRLVYGLAVLAVVVLIIGVGVALAWPAIRARAFGLSALVGISVGALLLTVFLVINGFVLVFLEDFIIPLMYKYEMWATAAWRLWLTRWRAQPGVFLLYGLLRFAFSLAVGLGVALFACLTCCCCCWLLIPYINVAILLPVLAWERYWGPEFLRQFGPDYDVWLAAPPPAGPPALPPPPLPAAPAPAG